MCSFFKKLFGGCCCSKKDDCCSQQDDCCSKHDDCCHHDDMPEAAKEEIKK